MAIVSSVLQKNRWAGIIFRLVSSFSILAILVLIPLVAAIFIAAGAPARRTALSASGFNIVAFCIVLWRYLDTEGVGYKLLSSFPLVQRWGINLGFGADGLALLMLGLSVVVTFTAVLAARTPERSPNMFYACVMLISAGAIWAFVSTDVVLFYMAHELALIPTFLLIGIWGSGDRQKAAWKITIYLGVASFVLLLGLIGLYFSVPFMLRSIWFGFGMEELQLFAQGGLLQLGHGTFLLLFFGFGALVSLFPFHTWAPSAYAAAPAPAAMLHAGVMKKIGLYGIMRLVTPIFPEEVIECWMPLLLMLVVGNILYVGLVTVAQKRLDLMLGNSSVMHMGYAFLGILAWNTIGWQGAGLLMLAHGLTIAALFALCAALREKVGTLEFSELGGLAKWAPRMGLFFGLAAFASVGLPGFANFPAELLVFYGAFVKVKLLFAPDVIPFCTICKDTCMDWPPIPTSLAYLVVIPAAVWGIVISAVYMLRAYRRIFWGEARPEHKLNNIDIVGAARWAVVILLAVLLVVGVYPWLALQFLNFS